MDSDQTTRFVQLLTSHQPRLFAYISAALFGDSAAADVLQETNLHLWADAGDYDTNRDFLPWAIGYARQSVMAHRKKCSRSRLIFGEDVMDFLTHHFLEVEDAVDHRLIALQRCLKGLSSSQAELIRERYTVKTPVQSIAHKLNDSAHNISSKLHRIRKALARCVEQSLRTEDG